jgi:hypothetical protein
VALFPRIQSPCPVQGNLAAFMDGDMCRLCKRQVFDLSDVDDAGRVAFFANCKTEQVCISYKIPARLAAAALAASVVALPAAARTEQAPASDTVAEEPEDAIIVTGGIAPRRVSYVTVTTPVEVLTAKDVAQMRRAERRRARAERKVRKPAQP